MGAKSFSTPESDAHGSEWEVRSSLRQVAKRHEEKAETVRLHSLGERLPQKWGMRILSYSVIENIHPWCSSNNYWDHVSEYPVNAK